MEEDECCVISLSWYTEKTDVLTKEEMNFLNIKTNSDYQNERGKGKGKAGQKRPLCGDG